MHPLIQRDLSLFSHRNKLPEEEIRRRESRLRHSQRYKRAASNLDDTMTECQILITADQKLFQFLGSSRSASLNLLVNHVLEANTIFPETNFDSDAEQDLIRIAIKRAVVWDGPAAIPTVPSSEPASFSVSALDWSFLCTWCGVGWCVVGVVGHPKDGQMGRWIFYSKRNNFYFSKHDTVRDKVGRS